VGSGSSQRPSASKPALNHQPSWQNVRECRGTTVIKGVAEALPFRDNEFDTVLMVTTVCFLDELYARFQEAFRVLNPRAPHHRLH